LNKQKKSKYWFYIDSYIHISIKNRDVLYYNVYSGKILEFSAETNGSIILKITQRLLSPKNSRVIRLSPNDIENPVISNYLRLIRENFMGDLIEEELSNAKPLQIVTSQPKVHFDIKKVINEPDQSPGKSLMTHLYEVSVYLNDYCQQNCPECHSFFKQGIWCRKAPSSPRKPGKNNIDILLLKKLIIDIKASNLSKINLSGGNLLLYPHLEELHKLFESVNFKIHFFLHYLNIENNLKLLKKMRNKNYKTFLLAHLPIDINRLKKSIGVLLNFGASFQIIFFIQNDEEYSYLENILVDFPEESTVYLPYFNLKNLNFFKNNFYISREDIKNRKPEQRTIDGNSKINMDNFGKITIFPDGKVYANVMEPSLGNLKRDTIYDCIYRELIKGRSWFRVRKNVMPCKMCYFNLLCPPLTNYNRIIGKNNLCTIWHQ